MSQANWTEGLLELDWLKTPNLILLSLLFIAVRVPMIFLGFGLDPDAWRIANSAFDLRHHLVYHTSRFPGYPLPELADSLLINFGWVATNSLTMLLSLLSVIAFAYLLKEKKIRNKGLLTLTYAFMPLLLINSTNSMDYMWGLSFIVFAWFFLTRKKFITAGMMMGLAVSSRPQMAPFVIPLVFLITGSKMKKTHIIQFMLASLVVSIVSFVPVYMTYGFEFIRHYPARTNLLQTGYGGIKYFGIPSLVVLILIGITSFRNVRMMIGKHSEYDLFVLLSFTVACLSFALTPYHFEYVIPIIPFGLIFISRIGKKPLVAIFCCFVILHGCLTFASVQHTGNRQISVRTVDYGAVIKNYRARREQIASATQITEADVDARSVVLVGPWLPVVAYLGKEISSSDNTKKMYDSNIQDQGVWNFPRRIWYRYLIDLEELIHLVNGNFKIYYVEGVREYTLEVYGYDLNEHGALPLE
jgi:hypothetical protein